MKPSKKQIHPNATKITKTQVNDKNLGPGIQTFFKTAPKNFVVDKNVAQAKSDDDDRQFFVEVLKEKLRACDENCVSDDKIGNELCQADGAVGLEKEHRIHTEAEVESQVTKSSAECTGCVQKAIKIDEWEHEYKQEVEQRKELKKVYLNLTIRFSELHSKYDDLLKAATKANHTTGDAPESLSDDNIFTPNEIKFLECMALDQKIDCSFIHHCLKYAYKSDPSVLVSRTLKGTIERTEISKTGEEIHHSAKGPLTPQKVERIKGLFIQRIAKCGINSAEYSERIKDANVNRLFAAGIKNLSKTFKAK